MLIFVLWSLITNSYTLLPPSSFSQIYIYICGQHDALYAIINSNYLLSLLKAPLNIECHFLFIIPYIYIYWLSIAKLIICGQRDALHAIINSNYLLSILKAPLNIECHFLFIIHIYMCVCVCVCNKFYYSINFTSSTYFECHKNKNLFFSLLIHTYNYIFSNISLPSLPLYLLHYSLLHRYTFFIIFSFS